MDADLARALAALPAEERRLLLLRYGEHVTVSQIARRTGAEPAALRRSLRAALDRLHATLYPPSPIPDADAPRCDLALTSRRLTWALTAGGADAAKDNAWTSPGSDTTASA